jgi:hypothetical protein
MGYAMDVLPVLIHLEPGSVWNNTTLIDFERLLGCRSGQEGCVALDRAVLNMYG